MRCELNLYSVEGRRAQPIAGPSLFKKVTGRDVGERDDVRQSVPAIWWKGRARFVLREYRVFMTDGSRLRRPPRRLRQGDRQARRRQDAGRVQGRGRLRADAPSPRPHHRSQGGHVRRSRELVIAAAATYTRAEPIPPRTGNPRHECPVYPDQAARAWNFPIASWWRRCASTRPRTARPTTGISPISTRWRCRERRCSASRRPMSRRSAASRRAASGCGTTPPKPR